MNLNNLTELNGQKLTKTHIKTLDKIHALGVRAKDIKETRTNPYSKATRELEPVAVALHDFIILQYHAGNVGTLVPLNLWNNARYLFNVIWPDEYYALID